MPPLPPANKILKVRFIGDNQGFVWNCIMHSQYTSASPSTADLTGYATAAGTAWGNNIGPLCGANVNLTSVDVIDLTSATSPSATVNVAHAGTLAGTTLPASTALVSSWQANLRYRGGHVRNYWPGGTQAELQNVATWLGTFITQATAGFQAFLTSMNAIPLSGGTSQLVLLSYRTNNAPRPTPIPVTITGVNVHPRIDTQRKRLGKERP